jgi:hypothetical protein
LLGEKNLTGDTLNEKITFDEKFSDLGEYYNIKSPADIKNQIQKNENIFIFLEEIKPYLEKSFNDAEFCLEMNFEPEIDDKYIVLRVYVSDERFDNGAFEDIYQIREQIRPLRRKINVFRELAIRPAIKNV